MYSEIIHLQIFYLFAVFWHVSTCTYGINTGFLKNFNKFWLSLLLVRKLSFIEGVPVDSSFFLTDSGKLSNEWGAACRKNSLVTQTISFTEKMDFASTKSALCWFHCLLEISLWLFRVFLEL